MSKKAHPYLKYLLDYSHDVVLGKVIACQKHIWACSRFISDIDRSCNDPNFNYEFDGAKAEQFVKWARLFKHTKGELSGKYIELAPITHFVAGNIYGWYHKKTGYRRFKKMYWQVARKNGKSQLLSLMASYELFVFSKDEKPEIYCAATKTEQAKIVYDETETIVRACEALIENEDYKIRGARLIRTKDLGFIRPLSKDDKKKADGYNPQFATIDEYHAHDTTEIYDVMNSGMKFRPQALLAVITTAGHEINNPCYRIEYDIISKILNPENPLSGETYFVMVNELESNRTDESLVIDGREVKPGDLIDDIEDYTLWEKANPVVCTADWAIELLKDELELARESPEKMRDFLTKNMNVWVNQREMGYMNMAKWNSCAVTFDELIQNIKENTDGTPYVGLDLSMKDDLTSASFEFVGNDEKYYVLSHSFIPQGVLHQKIKKDRVPYDMWEKEGWITCTEGDVVDYRAVKHWVMNICKEYGWVIAEVCIDPYAAVQISADLIDDGIEVINIKQGAQTLSEPTKDFRYMVNSNRIVHCDDPVLSWAMGNAVTKVYHNESMLLDKAKAKQRIDPAAALMNSHTRAMCVEVESQNRVMFI